MNKKLFSLTTTLLLVLLFASCGTRRNVEPQPIQIEWAVIEARLEAMGYTEEMIDEMDEEQRRVLIESVLEDIMDEMFEEMFGGLVRAFADAFSDTAVAAVDACPDGEWVRIRGLRWATRNVDTPGTFTENPEDFGMLFQWNNKNGRYATDEIEGSWIDRAAIGTAWYPENDPCPQGWRVPTLEELRDLYGFGSRWQSEWAVKNGVNGRLFGIAPNQIFLPAAGRFDNESETLRNVGERGSYWTNLQTNSLAWHFHFSEENSGTDPGWVLHWRSVRCVAIE